MEGHIERSAKVTVEFDHKEIQWLKNTVQNPPCLPDEESEEHRGYRESLWDILSEALNA